MKKEKAIIEMVIRWLDSNIDEAPPEGVQEDSANLKEKIQLALDPEATIEDIESGNLWVDNQVAQCRRYTSGTGDGSRLKDQATSNKPQAASDKLQAWQDSCILL